jgi:hypothetical protein
MIDHRVIHGLYTLPVRPSEIHMVETCERVYKIVLTRVVSEGEQWITLELLHRGLKYDEEQ